MNQIPVAITFCDGLSRKERLDVATDEIYTLYETLNDNSIGNIVKISGIGIHYVSRRIKDYELRNNK